MEEQVKIINRANYNRPYLVRKVEFEPRSVVLIKNDELDALTNNSPEYQQLLAKGALVIQGAQDDAVRVMNTTFNSIVLRYAKVLLRPGENYYPKSLWNEVLETYGEQVWLLQGQPDGLVF